MKPELKNETIDALEDTHACDVEVLAFYHKMDGGDMDRIMSLSEKVQEHVPDDERIDHIAYSFDEWSLPVVRVWCKCQGFDYSNSQVHDVKFMTHGRVHTAQVDVRPF